MLNHISKYLTRQRQFGFWPIDGPNLWPICQ